MADNVTLDAGSGGAVIAADEATYSGDTTQVQLVRLVHVTGAEGAKTISELVYAEDAAHSSGHFGFQALAVRTDTPANRSGADGDYEPLQVAAGRLWCSATIDAALPAGTNAIGKLAANSGVDIGDVDVTSVVPGTGATNLGKAIDTATGGTDTGVLLLATRDDALAALTPIEGDNVQLRTDANGALWVIPSGTVTVGSHAVTNAGTFAVQVDGSALTALQLIDDVVFAEDTAAQAADKGVAVLAVRRDADTSLVGTDNDYANLQVDANGYLKVEVFDGGGSHTVDNAGTFAVQVDGNALTALQLIDDPVFADDAAYTIGTSKVMVAGGVVDDDSTDAADEGDAVALRATKERKLRVVAALDSAAMQSGNDEVTPKFAVIDAATSGDNTLVAAVASKKCRVLALFLVAAGTVNVRFESGAGGTALTGQMNLVVNTGFVLPFNPVGWFETAANTLLNLELSGAVSVDGSLTYIEVD